MFWYAALESKCNKRNVAVVSSSGRSCQFNFGVRDVSCFNVLEILRKAIVRGTPALIFNCDERNNDGRGMSGINYVCGLGQQ